MPENRHMDLPGEGEVRRAALLHRQRAAVGEQLDPLGRGGFTENVRDLRPTRQGVRQGRDVGCPAGQVPVRELRMTTRFDIARRASLTGANLERCSLKGKRFVGVHFDNANLRAADISRAIFIQCSFHKTDFSRANLYLAEFQECDLTGADLSMAYLKGVLFRGCMLAASIWRRANAKNSLFVNCDMTLADVAFAEFLGAKFDGTTTEPMRNASRATYIWWSNPHGGPASYEPVPGWPKMTESALGTITFQENAAREKIENE